jgi:DNA-binding transcriptional regulator YiaG
MTGKELRASLRWLKLSQRQFAFRLHLDVGTVNRWATDKRRVPESIALLLACWRSDGGPPKLK